MPSASVSQNMTANMCIELAIRILERERQEIINPLTNHSMIPDPERREILSSRRRPSITRTLLSRCQRNGDIPARFVDLVTYAANELQGDSLWSPWARSNNIESPGSNATARDLRYVRNLIATFRAENDPRIPIRMATPTPAPEPEPAPASTATPTAPTSHSATTITPNQCVQLAINVLMRTTTSGRTVVNPITRRLIDPDGTTFARIFRQCTRNHASAFHGSTAIVVNGALNEMRRIALYSEYARRTYTTYHYTTPQQTDLIWYAINDIRQNWRRGRPAAQAEAQATRQLSPNTLSTMRIAVEQRMSGYTQQRQVLNDEGYRQLPEDIQTELMEAWNRQHASVRIQSASAPSVSNSGHRPTPVVETTALLADFSRSPRTRRIASSRSLNNEERQGLIEFCSSKFTGLPALEGSMKRFINKLKRVCNTMSEKTNCQPQQLNAIVTAAARRYKIRRNEHYTLRIPPNPSPHHHIQKLYELYSTRPASLHYGSLDKFFVQSGRAIDAGGVRRQYMQSAAIELKKLGIFTETDDNTGIYKFKPEFAGSDKLARCKFAGAFVAFCIVNGIKLDFNLSKSILASLIYKPEEIDNDYYAMFYLSEYSSHGRSMVNLMRSPNDIQYVGLEFNDGDIVLDTTKEGDDNNVNVSNFREYVGKLGVYKLTHGTSAMLQNFKEGFYITRRFLGHNNVSVAQLDALITGTKLTSQNRNSIASKVATNYIRYNPDSNNNQSIIWLCEIIREGNTFYPMDEVQNAPHLPQDFDTFMKMLCFFWTSSQYYNTNLNYSAQITRSANFVAHTCSQLLDVPYGFTSRDQMFRQLIRSVTDTSFGFA